MVFSLWTSLNHTSIKYMGPIKKKFQINTRMLYGIHPLHIKRPLTLTIFQKETVYDKKQHTLPLNHDS